MPFDIGGLSEAAHAGSLLFVPIPILSVSIREKHSKGPPLSYIWNLDKRLPLLIPAIRAEHAGG
ncbi:MAG: hypothetical protein JWQ98_891 [Chlorobi bacterium]|jgi:hypothetical protein|nr:hypothetical protein [Chlorobiota bacterium]